MKVLAKRAGSLVEGVLRRRTKRRRGLPVVTGLVSCAIGVAVAAMAATAAPTALAVEASAGAAGTQTESEEAVGAGGEMGAAVADDPAALPAVSADDDQVTVTVPTEVPCVMLGDGSVIGPATWCIENGSDKGARLANVHAERKTLSVEASAATKGGTALLDVSPDAATFNQGFELAAGESADVAWSVAVTDDVERSEALSGALLGPTSLLALTFTFAAVEEDPGSPSDTAFAGLTSHVQKTVYLDPHPAQLARSALHEMGHYMDSRLGWPSQSPEFKEAFAAERDSYASFYEYGATDEYEMFASMCRDVLMGVRGGDKAAPRCTALVEEAIQGGIPYDFTLGNAI